MNLRQFIGVILGFIALLFMPALIFKGWENLDANQIMLIQMPISGQMKWCTTPGTWWQGFGTVTKYDKRDQFWFSSKGDQGKSGDESIKIRFNDGAHANISGSLSWEMPLDDAHLTLIHTKYGSQAALEHQLIRTNLEKSLYMTGPLMSSAESYAARRNDLLGLIEEQFLRGVFKTTSRDERTEDVLTGQKKTIKVVEPVKGPDGQFEREEESPLIALGIKAFNISINDVKYDKIVEDQIAEQQKAIMAVQTAIAETKTAEQKTQTVAAQGEAKAKEAEWAQKVLTAQATTLADQEKQVAVTKASMEYEVAMKQAQRELEVAQLATQQAEQRKLAAILEGEGEAEARKLIMEADGALQKKLDAWVVVNGQNAMALGNYQGNLVPQVIFGGSGDHAATTAGVPDLLGMFAVKTAKDLGIDMSVPSKAGNLREIARPKMPEFKYTPAPTQTNNSRILPTPKR